MDTVGLPPMKKLFLILSCLMLLNLRLAAEEPRPIRLDFPNVPVADLLAFYGTLTGQQIVYDNSVQGAVTVKTSQPVSKEQAEAMIEEALFLDGFALVDSEDGSILKVIGLGKPARSYGVPVFANVADFPKHERVVSLLVNLRHADAQKTAGLLGSYTPPTAVNSFTPLGERTLILTGPASLLRRLLKVVEAMDTKDNVPAEPIAPMPNQGKPQASPVPSLVVPRPVPAPKAGVNDDDDDD